jgi:hypothetical protein
VELYTVVAGLMGKAAALSLAMSNRHWDLGYL